jgi:hypothetical protein
LRSAIEHIVLKGAGNRTERRLRGNADGAVFPADPARREAALDPCSWPNDAPCPRTRRVGSSYCDEHHRAAYLPGTSINDLLTKKGKDKR